MNKKILLCALVVSNTLACVYTQSTQGIQNVKDVKIKEIKGIKEIKKEETAKSQALTPTQTKSKTRKIEDRIIVRVNGRNILASDLEMPRINKAGGKFSLDEAIMEELFYQRAAELHMLPTAIDIERQLVAFKIQNNLTEMTDAEFEKELKDSGFSSNMYKNQLGRLMAMENVKRAEVSEKSLITSQEVEAYYQAHKDEAGAFTKDRYYLKTCTIEQSEKPLDKQELMSNKKVTWDDLDWIEKKDLKPEWSFVKEMKKDDISDPIIKENMLEYVLLANKEERRPKTLDERYGEIELQLQEEKRAVLWKKFEQTIKEKAVIVNLS